MQGGGPGITIEELSRRVRDTDPEAFLVPPRLIRRVINHLATRALVGLRVPHRKCLAVDAAEAFRAIDRDELGLSAGDEGPATLLLLAAPEPEELDDEPAGAALVRVWRLLFHARIHAEYRRRIAAGGLPQEAVRERVRRLGTLVFDEAREVLRREDLLLEPDDDRAVFVEFAATYLDLRRFADHLLPAYLPAIDDYEGVDALLAEDLDVEALYRRTRPIGAPEPDQLGPIEPEPPAPAEAEDRPGRSEPTYRRLMQRADAAAAVGNLVRAILLRSRAARLVGPARAGQARAEARRGLERLAQRLQAALGREPVDRDAWVKALLPLADRAASGFWTVEGRLLYDLQKICVDHERDIYIVDLLEWAKSFGRRPIKRLLPNQRHVLACKHLRNAIRRSLRARLGDDDRDRLAEVLHEALDHAQFVLRERLRPLIARSLERSEIIPRNLPERVALRKLIEELLDQVVARDFLAMGDLRDALARSSLKLPDLTAPELVRGDRLLRADRRLAIALDGVYRRGEIYLRLLQRFSSLAFGTRIGRFLTRNLALPFGGAFVVLKGLNEVIEIGQWLGQLGGGGAPASGHHAGGGGPHLELVHPATVLGLGVYLLGLIHSARLRALSWRGLRGLGRGFRALAIDLPSWFLGLPMVRRVLASPVFQGVASWLLKPAIPAGLAYLGMRGGHVDWESAGWVAGAIFGATALTLNTRTGRRFEEALADWAVRSWHRLRVDLLPGLVRLILETFDRLLEAIERLLYTVDEWLRFRSGETWLSLALKAALGVVWSLTTYVIRFFINLLAEPQLNPIKHFPVVTVSHKVIAPYIILQLPALLESAPLQLSKEAAYGTAFTTQLLLPGVFGFIAWELKENWRLYEANRPEALRPVIVGHHGETMARLLRPGFHSGTIPRLFARLRKAERRAEHPGRARETASRHRESLHHVEAEIRHFLERDFLELLHESRALDEARVELDAIRLATNRVRASLIRWGRADPPLVLQFELPSGWLVARLAEPGWLDQLSERERRVLATALAGLYKMAAVDLVGEQITSSLPPGQTACGLTPTALLACMGDNGPPRSIDLCDAPAAELARIRFGKLPLTWAGWVAAWTLDQDGQSPPSRFADGITLPASAQDQDPMGRAHRLENGPHPASRTDHRGRSRSIHKERFSDASNRDCDPDRPGRCRRPGRRAGAGGAPDGDQPGDPAFGDGDGRLRPAARLLLVPSSRRPGRGPGSGAASGIRGR